MTGTDYGWRNLPTRVTANGSMVRYAYDANGNRVKKQLVDEENRWHTTWYVRGADGQTVAAYNGGGLLFLNILAGGEIIGNLAGDERRYFVKDHLGSVRTTVDRNGNVVGRDDYYPFGLTMPRRSSNSANPNDDYKFTGYEKDDEARLDLYHAGARGYDPVLGRFNQVDRFYDKYPFISPYSYTLNNPVNFTDITGDTVDVSHLDSDVQNWLVDHLTQFTGLGLYVENGVLLYNQESEVNTNGTSEAARNDLMGGISHEDRVWVKARSANSDNSSSYSNSKNTIFLNLDNELYKEQNSVGVNPLTVGLGMTFMHELNHSHIGAFGRYEPTESLVVGRQNLYRSQIGSGMGLRQQYNWIEDKNIGRIYAPYSPDGSMRVYLREVGGPRPYHRKN